MTDKEILEKAIRKSVDNGWQAFEFGEPTHIEKWNKGEMVEIAIIFPLHENPITWVRELEGIIFNHEFAKAVWGEKAQVPPGKERFAHQDYYRKNYPAGWQYHLQQMVIAENPIQYLGENI